MSAAELIAHARREAEYGWSISAEKALRLCDLAEDRRLLRAAIALIDALPRCELCLEPANLGSPWCSTHCPIRHPEHPRAGVLRELREAIAERGPADG